MSNPLQQRKSNGLGPMSFDPNDPWGTKNQMYMAGLGAQSAAQSFLQQYAQWQQVYGSGLGLGTVALPPAPTPAISPKDIERLKKAEPRQVLARMPDSVVSIVAWRAWAPRVLDGGQWGLGALGQTHIWIPKKAMEAVCCASDPSAHPAPHRDCTCGIWSFRSLDELLPALAGYAVKVFGQVTIWGRIIECEHGFRSQFAYPKELWLLDPSMEQLGYTYGVPIRTAK